MEDRGRDGSRRPSSTPASSTSTASSPGSTSTSACSSWPRTSSIPLLERVKFLAIYASNLDEFFMVRVAGLHDQVDAGIDDRKADGLSPVGDDRARRRAQPRARRAPLARSGRSGSGPALAEQGIRIDRPARTATRHELEAVDRIFDEQIFPVLTPLAVGPGRPFPYISNLSLSLAVWLRDPVSGDETLRAREGAEGGAPALRADRRRRVRPARGGDRAPPRTSSSPGMEILRHAFFRVTRDADFTVSDEADDLLRAVEDELRRRRFGEVVRLEVSHDMEPSMRELPDRAARGRGGARCTTSTGCSTSTTCGRSTSSTATASCATRPGQPVSRRPFADEREDGRRTCSPRCARATSSCTTPTTRSRPASSASSSRPSADPDVLAIKMTVYRTSDDSALVPSLIEAAERGKQAVCLVELKARFDERRNIGWARSLEEAGAHVVHGLPGPEDAREGAAGRAARGRAACATTCTSAPATTTRRPRASTRTSASSPCDPEIAADVAELFNALTGAARPPGYRKAIVAPDHMRDWFLEEVAQDDRGARARARRRGSCSR